jgi:F0F1-type ATP synthase epsilon subunit
MPNEEQTFLLIIRTRQDVVFEDQVTAITSVNEQGTFDVLPRHAFFISLIHHYVLIHQKGGGQKRYEIDVGILYVGDEKVSIYLETPPRLSTF